jgi:hypothetical protein
MLPTYEIINQIWSTFFKSGSKVTKEDVALIFNPGHPLNGVVMDMAGGDCNAL